MTGFRKQIPKQVKHLCLDHRASCNLLENALQRLCKGVAVLLLVSRIEVAEQQSVRPPANGQSRIAGVCMSATFPGSHAKTFAAILPA